MVPWRHTGSLAGSESRGVGAFSAKSWPTAPRLERSSRRRLPVRLASRGAGVDGDPAVQRPAPPRSRGWPRSRGRPRFLETPARGRAAGPSATGRRGLYRASRQPSSASGEVSGLGQRNGSVSKFLSGDFFGLKNRDFAMDPRAMGFVLWPACSPRLGHATP